MFLGLIITGIIFSTVSNINNIKQNNARKISTQDMIYSAKVANDKQQYNEAIIILDKVIKKSPKHKKAYYLKGLNYTKLKDYDRALVSLHKAISLDVNDSVPYNYIGIVYYEQEKYKEAKKWFLESLKKDNLYHKALYNLGNTYYINKDYKIALKWYKKAYSVEKNEKDILVYMGNCYSFLNQPLLSIQTYKKVLKLEPENYMMYYYMAYDFMSIKDYENSEKYYIIYISNSEKNKITYDPYVNLFEIELIQNKPFHKQIEKDFLNKFDSYSRGVMIYEMLKIFQKLSIGDKVDLNIWQDKYRDMDIEKWNFSFIDIWVKKEKNSNVKFKLMEATRIFKNHKK